MLHAAAAGLVGTGEKVPWSCQTPFRKFEESMHGHEQFASFFHKQAVELRNSPKWKQVELTPSPDLGDITMESQDQMGTYHFIRSTFTVPQSDMRTILGYLTSSKKSLRAEYSADITELEYFAEEGNEQLFRIAYAAPSVGGAGRDFIFLASKRQLSPTTWETWGCSVDIASRPEDYEGYVRGAALYHWILSQNGPDCLVSYSACFDPRGWAPPFLIEWYKTSATKEFIALRKVCSRAANPVAALAAQKTKKKTQQQDEQHHDGSSSASSATESKYHQSSSGSTVNNKDDDKTAKKSFDFDFEPGSPSDFL